ncbi:Uncharacterized protein TCM_043232 [Theobroma cacao]|uniref:Uncharacterized protein n=1 Tax=Theobroma cacao TaxID=3641 RepID=A0A061FVB6_THECC|nr:Uncharacterized protein TCM_043232 [Theobroma cacao]
MRRYLRILIQYAQEFTLVEVLYKPRQRAYMPQGVALAIEPRDSCHWLNNFDRSSLKLFLTEASKFAW